MNHSKNGDALPAIAIIGMAARLPGANNLDEFWRNLSEGAESISTFTGLELETADGDPALFHHPLYVKRRAILEGVDLFDAAFFNYTPREAELSDPQQRFFIQCAWEALETAGYDPERFPGLIGIFGGSGFSHYLFSNLLSNRELLDSVGFFETSIRNRPDHLATNAAYKLNLKGPALTVQTACSTSLVALHLACQSLINFECDMALAGGVSIALPQKSGYLYREGGILSPDGHCRAFDAAAQGTVIGNGAAVIVLKRLEDALANRDNIDAVILGSAIGNDGSLKAGYAAPGIEGQAQVIAEAQAVAGVHPNTISYIETHGTGTKLGDPIEIAALNQVFRQTTDKRNFCAIGSVKTNIGHLDAASGIAGLIKVVLSLKHKMLPPSLHFERPNKEIDFSESPFFVNTKLRAWDAPGPRRAGVSSFGIGGTNAHAILEQPPEVISSKETRPCQLLTFSTKIASALDSATNNLAAFLQRHRQDVNLADVAYTLQTGRREFKHRRAVVCRDHNDALKALKILDSSRTVNGIYEGKHRSIVFMFPGQGAQYVDMGKALFRTEATFRNELERCATLARPWLDFELLDLLYPKDPLEARFRLTQTQAAQPALFAIEYSLARLWVEWGIQPAAMIGHSIGEYVAACLAGVWSLEDALRLVTTRGRLMQSLQAGTMLVVQLPEEELTRRLIRGLDLAAINGPGSCVVAGPAELIEQFEAQLSTAGIACRKLITSHAFHSAMMDPILGPFRKACSQVSFHFPQLPFISNRSGTWITADEATSPDYWTRHVREAVRFGDGLRVLLQEQDSILLEVGPGRTLATLARKNPHRTARHRVLRSLRQAEDRTPDDAILLDTLGKLWAIGVQVDWSGFYRHEQRKRVPLPVYPFEPRRYWIEPKKQITPDVERPQKKDDITEWFYTPSWKSIPLVQRSFVVPQRPWLVFVDQYGCGLKLVEQLQRLGAQVFTVEQGPQYSQEGKAFTLRPDVAQGYELMITNLQNSGQFPDKIVHLWNLAQETNNPVSSQLDIDLSFWSPLFLARAIGSLNSPPPTELVLISNNLYNVIGDKTFLPERATLLGPCRVVPQEYANISCRHLDLDILPGENTQPAFWSDLVADIVSTTHEQIVAYRRGHRWVQSFEPLSLVAPPDMLPILREKGTYLITGGLGGIGLTLAEDLAQAVKARLILLGRSGFPSRETWTSWLETHDEEDSTSTKIRKFISWEKNGAEVLVVTADVRNPAQLSSAISLANQRFGKIHGVLHCAGIPGGGVIQLKTAEAALAVLAPKVQGAVLLAAALENSPPDFFIACSSRASILGGFGQVDYCAGSAFLDVFAHHYRSKHSVPVISVNWDAWQDVGMLARKSQESEVGTERTLTAKNSHPLLGQRVVESSERETFTSALSATSHWILDEHRVLGGAVLPGVAYLEMARAAAETHRSGAIEITDAFFIEPLHFRQQEQRQVKIILEPEHDKDNYFFRVQSQGYDTGAAWREHATATVGFFDPGPSTRNDLEAIARRCDVKQVRVEEDWVDEAMGARWHVYRNVLLGTDELLAFLELPEEFAPELQQLKLYPALLDRGVALAKRLLVTSAPYVPVSYRRLRIRAPLERKIYVYIQLHPSSAKTQETVTFDVLLMNERGEELVAIEGFSEKRIDINISKKVLGNGHEHRENHFMPGSPPKIGAVVAGVYMASLQRGITPEEGQEAFRYILSAAELSQIIVSTTSLQASIVEARKSAALNRIAETTDALLPYALHPRPDIQTSYIAPRNELETKIAESWQKVLGVAEIGIYDNYFELGGDSVQAIQIIAQMNRKGFHLTPQQLFQHQTVAELAQVAAGPEPIPQKVPAVALEPASTEFPLSGLNEEELKELEGYLEETDKTQIG